MMTRTRFTKLVAILLASSAIASAMAYEEDSHFQMAYLVCRSAGMTNAEALKVAAVDQGMDDSSGTVANGGIGGVIPNIPEESLWHALDKDGKMHAPGVTRRKDELFHVALTRATDDQKLFYLGVFFHFQQDTWAHRHHYDGRPHSYDAYTTYNTPFGHAKDMHQPDRPPFDPIAAVLCFEDGIRYATRFVREGLHRTPRAFFANYRPMGASATVDKKWSKEGKYYHQIHSFGDENSPQRFVAELIRGQVAAYESSLDPYFGGRYTAKEASFNRTRTALNAVCQAFARAVGEQFIVPTKAEKEAQGFMHMTTEQIRRGMG